MENKLLTPSPCCVVLDDPEPARRDQNPSIKTRRTTKCHHRFLHSTPWTVAPQNPPIDILSHNINRTLNIPSRRHPPRPPRAWIPIQPLNPPTPLASLLRPNRNDSAREAQDTPSAPDAGSHPPPPPSSIGPINTTPLARTHRC